MSQVEPSKKHVELSADHIPALTGVALMCVDELLDCIFFQLSVSIISLQLSVLFTDINLFSMTSPLRIELS